MQPPKARPPSRRRDVRLLAILALVAGGPSVAASAPEMGDMAGMQHGGEAHAGAMQMVPLGLAQAREGSGTAWLPDSSPMYMLAWKAGPGELDLMWNGFLQYAQDGGRRGRSQLGSVNWLMGMWRAPAAGGQVRARAMLSFEPWTVGRCGYPDLLATGETCRGGALHDRQHPHDLFMELSAGYAHALGDAVAVDVYGALSGEPALGPAAFPHRPSSMPDPIAPMTHHWLDSTHISFGVLTAGVYGRRWKVEGSVFNAREPNEHRTDLDLGPLDSASARVWLVPDEHWALQASIGFLHHAEANPEGGGRSSVTRATASAAYHRAVGADSYLAATLGWGRNSEHGRGSNGVLAEAVLDLHERDVVFGRVEAAEKTAPSLSIAASDAERWVGKLSVGYERQLRLALDRTRGILFGLGAGASVNAVPPAFAGEYGERWPVGFVVFAEVRPAPMDMGAPGQPRR